MVGDAIVEASETVHLTLSDPNGGAVLDEDRSTMIVQILDERPFPFFAGSGLAELVGIFLFLLLAFDPLWLLVLLPPALYLGYRRWRLLRPVRTG